MWCFFSATHQFAYVLCALDAFMLCHTLQLFLLLQGLEERGTRPITDAFSKTASAVKS